MKTDPSKTNPDARYRTLLILWFALSMSILIYLVFVQLATTEVNPNQKLSLALNTLGLVPVALSFLFKQKILDRSVEEQRSRSGAGCLRGLIRFLRSACITGPGGSLCDGFKVLHCGF